MRASSHHSFLLDPSHALRAALALELPPAETDSKAEHDVLADPLPLSNILLTLLLVTRLPTPACSCTVVARGHRSLLWSGAPLSPLGGLERAAAVALDAVEFLVEGCLPGLARKALELGKCEATTKTKVGGASADEPTENTPST